MPDISVVIPTRDRAALLESSLGSLERQTLPIRDLEVIVVDDGSVDGTPAVCERWSSRLPLTRLSIERSGIAAAKNAGISVAASPILLFLDDDDVADGRLLAEHLDTHAGSPADSVAVLGYTEWDPRLKVTEVMRYVTDVGHDLFSYSHLEDGQRLGFPYFWGGRTSCKKALLTAHGVHDPQFTFGCEDIELAYRLSQLLDLTVVFNRKAVQYMNRSVTYDEFCRRCERQGRSQAQFSRLHCDPIVHQWAQTAGAVDRWAAMRGLLPIQVARVHELEAQLAAGVSAAQRDELLPELYALYRRTFDAFKTKGIVERAT